MTLEPWLFLLLAMLRPGCRVAGVAERTRWLQISSPCQPRSVQWAQPGIVPVVPFPYHPHSMHSMHSMAVAGPSWEKLQADHAENQHSIDDKDEARHALAAASRFCLPSSAFLILFAKVTWAGFCSCCKRPLTLTLASPPVPVAKRRRQEHHLHSFHQFSS